MDFTTWKEDDTIVMEFPGLKTVSLDDVEVQKTLIKSGVAVGIPGGNLVFTKGVQLRAGSDKTDEITFRLL